MKNCKLMGSMLLAAAAAAGPGAAQAALVARPAAPAQSQARAVDLVICLDTSGSMSGLIDAARQKLWAIVNDLALAQPAPRLRVALLSFGNDGHSAESGWVELQTGLTEDLDLVAERLFALGTNGGTELVGRVLQAALRDLEWSAAPGALKLMLVAGNESADQDQVANFREVCKAAISRDILVNAIYCGGPGDADAAGWQEVARLADGHFAAIDQNTGTVVIETPFDAELATLSEALNGTYVPFGVQGEQGWNRQAEADANAAGLNSANAAQRAVSKAGGLYQCSWDLVDACKNGGVKLDEVKEEDLPAELRALSLEDLRAYLAEKERQRGAIQQQIAQLNGQRERYVQEQMSKLQLSEGQAFDNAVRQAIRAQAAGKGFQYPPPTEPPAPPAAPALIMEG